MYNERKKYDESLTVDPALLNAVQHAQRTIGSRFDANDTAYLARELEQFLSDIQRIEYTDLKARALFPVDSKINTGAESFIWKVLDSYGKAKIVDNYATDFPNVELKGLTQTGIVKSVGASYQFSYQDLRAATFAGFALEDEKARAARRAIEEAFEQIAAFGDGSSSLTGLFNAPVLPTIFSPGTAAGLGLTAPSVWESATPLDVMKDVESISKIVFGQTKNRFMDNGLTLVVGTKNWALLATRLKSPTYTDSTLYTSILASNPFIKSIEYWPMLDAAGPSGKERVMLYSKMPEVVQMTVPQEFEQFAPQVEGMVMSVHCHARIGTLKLKVPAAMCFLDGTVA